MAGLDATETGNELSQPKFEFTSLWITGRVNLDFLLFLLSIVGCNDEKMLWLDVNNTENGELATWRWRIRPCCSPCRTRCRIGH